MNVVFSIGWGPILVSSILAGLFKIFSRYLFLITLKEERCIHCVYRLSAHLKHIENRAPVIWIIIDYRDCNSLYNMTPMHKQCLHWCDLGSIYLASKSCSQDTLKLHIIILRFFFRLDWQIVSCIITDVINNSICNYCN